LTFLRAGTVLALPVRADALAVRAPGLLCPERLETAGSVQSIG
jgi:hypothetical protein